MLSFMFGYALGVSTLIAIIVVGLFLESRSVNEDGWEDR